MSSNLSVVIPAYNEEANIERTINAVLDQEIAPSMVYVVDNASTDKTPEIVSTYSGDVTLLHEQTKGTGAASRTGFAQALLGGAAIIARTDGDTVPRQNWTYNISEYLENRPDKVLVSGPSLPLKDEYYLPRDQLLLPGGRAMYKLTRAAMTGSLLPFRIAIGHNMAITAAGYEQIDGFAKTSIAELDEDIDLTLQVYRKFGYAALGYDRDMKVDTSMRRFRAVGYWGMNKYYKNPFKAPSSEERLAATDGNVDIR